MATSNPLPTIMGYKMDPKLPLHRLAQHRINNGRDLKIIITAKDSETGVGKTTCAGWLALTWTKHFAGHDWFCEPDDPIEGMGTLNPIEYFNIIRKVGDTWNPGTTIIVDDAEELDARRSMQDLNLKFSQRWMLMRLKQAITIITLPSPNALDSRLEELADVWINIEIRGRGTVHDIRVNSYGNRQVMTAKSHKLTFPNVGNHDELDKLRDMKERKMDDWDTQEKEEEKPDPEEVRKETVLETAQAMRDDGMTAKSVANKIPFSKSWVYKNTQGPQSGGAVADD